MKDYLKELNEKQIEAVLDTEGPSLIVAGAGSGKTKVLTSRIAYLIDELMVNPYNILAITFTNKASKEMNDRLTKLVGDVSRDLTCKTFHSFCAYVLRREIDILGERNHLFQIIDDDEAEIMVKDSMKNLGYDIKMIKPSSIQTDISLIKSKIKKLEDFNFIQIEKIEKIMNEYNKNLIKNNLLDYDDLIDLTLKIFKEYPKVLDKYQERYRYILVDEFQDTSNIQYELVELLASKYENIFIVGDEDQSIYSFRGANIKNIRKFMTSFKDHHKHILDENYRSTKQILDTANNLISNNVERIKKDLWTSKEGGKDVSLKIYDSDKEEARAVSRTIEHLVEDEHFKYSDFAILYRNNYLSRNFENDLRASRIPYRIYSGLSFYKRAEVKDMIAYLRLVINPDDFYSFKRVVNSPRRGIGDTTIERIESSFNTSSSIKEAIFKSKMYETTRLVLDTFMDTIYSLKNDFNKYNLKDFFNEVYERTGYKDYINEEEDEEKKMMRIMNIQELMSAIGETESLGSVEETLSDFLQSVALLTEQDVESKDPNHVSLITMHSAKGLEFKCVFLVSLEDDIIPGSKAVKPDELEEERRLLYVALTRAKENLYISSSTTRFQYGQVNVSRPSRFIRELKIKTDGFDKPRLSPFGQSPKKEFPKGEFKTGDRVHHELMGDGTVSAEIEGFYIIRFDDMPTPKKVIVNHPLLKRIN